MSDTFKMSCFCKKVLLEVSGDPLSACLCHCDSCRQWTGQPFSAYVFFKPENVDIVEGEEFVKGYSKTPGVMRKWCSECGGHQSGKPLV